MTNSNLYIAAALLALVVDARAHQPWVLADEGRVGIQEKTAIRVYFGHAFPEAELLDGGRLATIVLSSPSGSMMRIAPKGAVPFETPPLGEPGTWVIGVEQARGYWTKTPDGGRPLPLPDVEEAVRCSYSGNAAKTLVQVGEGGNPDVDRALGHRLEILPRVDPARLAAGDSVPIEVRFDGVPHAGPLIAFHAASGDEPYAMVETNLSGQAAIELNGHGPWMLLALAEIPYPDPTVCDVEAFHATLTFGGDR
jgi:uncharacterized GH25 family protein